MIFGVHISAWATHLRQVCRNQSTKSTPESSSLTAPRWWTLSMNWQKHMNRNLKRENINIISNSDLLKERHFWINNDLSPALSVWTTGHSAEVGSGGHALYDGMLIPTLHIQGQLFRDLIHPHQLTCGSMSTALVSLELCRDSCSLYLSLKHKTHWSYWQHLKIQKNRSIECCVDSVSGLKWNKRCFWKYLPTPNLQSNMETFIDDVASVHQ